MSRAGEKEDGKFSGDENSRGEGGYTRHRRSVGRALQQTWFFIWNLRLSVSFRAIVEGVS